MDGVVSVMSWSGGRGDICNARSVRAVDKAVFVMSWSGGQGGNCNVLERYFFYRETLGEQIG